MKALDTVLNLDYGEKLTRTQIEELKIAVNQITNKASRASDNNYRLRYENWKLRDQLAKANERVEQLKRELKGLSHESTQDIQRWKLRAEKAEEQLRKEQE